MHQSFPINADESPPIILDLIYKLKVKDVMTTELLTVTPHSSLRDVQHLMRSEQITGVPVVEGHRLLGMVSVDDIIRSLDDGYIGEAVSTHMSRNLIVLEDDMPLSFAISYIEKYQFGRFPVLNREKQLVGIVTSRDIIVALLVELDHEVIKLEEQVPHEAGHPTEEESTRDFNITSYDFENAGKASTELRKLLIEQGLDRKLIRRAAVAAYELEMNIVVHSHGGRLAFSLSESTVEITATDRGPGIEDVDQALTEGYSTATEWVRSLGFGAGMGLPNAQRVCDEFNIESSERGTSVRAAIHIPQGGTET